MISPRRIGPSPSSEPYSGARTVGCAILAAVAAIAFAAGVLVGLLAGSLAFA